ncbi:gluconeogenesis factor YvcK family protein [Cellulomonas composti]|uniref:Putative gluconeogenesis factor n=1 Tax=Cellulomonas composti TaxID=266130 RepID=A0A511J6I7_9CELL|nr:uridine diphosphate-N-acetylglucosamine-binding protein YvcK [Cellulomonas composti]GEL93608.1 hypothetical protein CCO02nite_02660 [Cellulomonas composti]
MRTPTPARTIPRGPAVTALGGGHGLAATLSAVRLMTDRITAVVTVADDGGSSGRLRDELDVLPPGDLRMALAALCDDSEWGRTWSDVMQHRFASQGSLDGHSVGNLLIAALWELLGDTVEGLDWVGRLLGARGRVLPMTEIPLLIEARVNRPDGTVETVRGQSAIARTRDPIAHVRLVPHDPPACAQAVAAIDDAQWVILGPGSWYTSVMPHLLVPGLRDALHRAGGRLVVNLNLSPDEKGETTGMHAEDYLDVLHAYAPEQRVHAVIADPAAVEDVDRLLDACAARDARLLLRQVSRGDGTPRHDPLRLASALRDVIDGVVGDVHDDEGDDRGND